MNTPNPLIPQLDSLQPQASRGKSSFRIILFTIVTLHVLFFGGLLMQGCNRDGAKSDGKTSAATNTQDSLPKLADSTYYSNFTELAPVTTNLPAPSTTDVARTVPSAPPVISQQQPIQKSSEPKESKEYTILKDDNFGKIAKAHGVKVSELIKANPDADPTKLKIGQKIQIPATAAVSSGGLGHAEPGPADGGKTHVVKSSETLTKIAQQHGTTVKALKAANNMTTDRLHVGQKLKLPAAQTHPAKGTTGTTSTSMSATNPEHVTPPGGSPGIIR